MTVSSSTHGIFISASLEEAFFIPLSKIIIKKYSKFTIKIILKNKH